MINTQLLEEKIEQSGLRINFISDNLGITRQALKYKRDGKKPFKKLEIEKLQSLLNLSDDDVVSIFLP